MERTATNDNEYVDIVLGYHHLLLFSLVFGLLIFAAGYFVGYYRSESGRTIQADAASATTASATTTRQQSPPLTNAPQVPVVFNESLAPAGDPDDVVKEMEEVSREGLLPSPAVAPEADSSPAAQPEQSEPDSEEPSLESASSAPPAEAPEPVEKSQPKPAAKRTEPDEVRVANLSREQVGRSVNNIYLQVSAFGMQIDAQQLVNDLSVDGYRARVDRELVAGKHTVLVGPYSSFKTALGEAKKLKADNHDAFPIRR